MELNESSLKEFRKIFSWVLKNKYSDFYRKKYKGKIDPAKIKTIDDFRKIPFLVRKDLVGVDPFEKLFKPFSVIKGVTATSGTTGSGPLVSFVSEKIMTIKGKRISANEFGHKRIMRGLGIKYFLNLRPPISLNNAILENIKPFTIFGDVNNLAATAEIAARVQIEAINASSTTLYFFTPYLKERYDLGKIKFIDLGGEVCSDGMQKMFRKTFPNALIICTYGSVESTNFAWQCDSICRKNIRLNHLLPSTIAECVDPIILKSVPKGQIGELVYTSLEKGTFVPIRYRTGDSIILKEEACECGSSDILLEVLGRIGFDSLKIQGVTLLASDVSKAIEKTQGLLTDFKAHVYEQIKNGRVSWVIELQLLPKNKQNIKNDVFKNKIRDRMERNFYVSANLTYGDLVKKDVFLPLKVQLLESLPFEQKRKHFVAHY